MGRAALTSDSIVATAAALCDEVGYSSLTLAGLSKRLRVQPPSIYKHLDGIDAVRNGVALVGLRDLNASLIRNIAGVTGVDAMLALGRSYHRFAREHPGVCTAIQSVPRTSTPEIAAEHELQIGIVTTVLAGCSVEVDRSEHTLRALVALLQGFGAMEARGDLDGVADAGLTLDTAIHALVAAPQMRGLEVGRARLRFGPFVLGLR